MRFRRKRIILLTSILVALPLIVATFYYEMDGPAVVSPKHNKSAKGITPSNPFIDDLLVSYDRSIHEILDETGIPGASIAIVRDTTVLYLKSFGVKTVGGHDSINQHTVFRIGSVSKCFAAVLTAILVKDSVLDWDDPVIKYLPDFKLKSPEQTKLLTIKHVLSHTTGLPYHTYTTLVEDGMDLESMIKHLSDVNDGPVGEVYSYQNVAFSIISKVIQAATGKTYEAMLEEKIFKPLEMREASATYEDILYNPNVAHPHLLRFRRWHEIPISDKYYNVAPAGGVNVSINDMTHWIKALLGNRPDVVSPESLHQIYTPVVRASSKNRSYRRIGRIKNNYYGLGWRILQFPDDTLIYHGGYVNGYRSEVAIYLRDKIGICILANAPGKVTDTGIPIFMQLYLAKRDSIQWWEDQAHVPLALVHEDTGL
jgi:beta-lactamase class C